MSYEDRMQSDEFDFSFLWVLSKKETIYIPKALIRKIPFKIGDLVRIYTTSGAMITSIISNNFVIYLPKKQVDALLLVPGDLVRVEWQPQLSQEFETIPPLPDTDSLSS